MSESDLNEEERKEPGPEPRQGAGAQAGGPPPEASFPVFLAGLYTQTLVALGEIENPLSGKAEANLPEAQYLIDIIVILQKKTSGNLTSEEESYLNALLHNLRMRYVEAARAGGEGASAQKAQGG